MKSELAKIEKKHWRKTLWLALVSSLVYQTTKFGFADVLGALGLIYFSLREGKEAFAKARGLECGCAAR